LIATTGGGVDAVARGERAGTTCRLMRPLRSTRQPTAKRSLVRTRVRATLRQPRRASRRWRTTWRRAAPGIVPRATTFVPTTATGLTTSDCVPGVP
jgi:hypothetical protein